MLRITRIALWTVALLGLSLIAPDTSAQTPARDFAAAWTAGGDLYVLLPSDAEPRIVAEGGTSIPRLSPDASYVAFQRRDSLYAVSTSGGEAQLIFDPETAPVREGMQASAGRRRWLDGDTLLYNTFAYSDFGGYSNDDLHIADMPTGQQIAAEIGGEFAPSPGGEWIAVTVAGFYGEYPGAVYIVDADGTNPREVMTYTAVATATEGQFAPNPQWVDADSFRVAIPDPELVYLDNESNPPPVMLWEVDALSGETVQIGTTPASFFGLPEWNDSGEWLAALMRAPTDQNIVVMMVGGGNGANPVEYSVDVLQGVRVPQWIPGADRFVYVDGGVMLGGPMMDSPVMLTGLEPVTTPAVAANGVVYPVEIDGVYEVRYAAFDGSDPVILDSTGDRVPYVNALSVGSTR